MATEPQDPIEPITSVPILDDIDKLVQPILDAYPSLGTVFSGIGVYVLSSLFALLIFLGHLIWKKRHRRRTETSPKSNLRNTYLKLMAEEWNTLRLQTLDPNAADTRARPLSLEQVYVHLYTTTPRPETLYLKDKEKYDSLIATLKNDSNVNMAF